MSYTPPTWNLADIEIAFSYTAPAWNLADIDLDANAPATQAIIVAGIAPTVAFGASTAAPGAATLLPAAIGAGAFGASTISNFQRFVLPAGLGAGAMGSSALVYNLKKEVFPPAISAGAFGTAILVNEDRPIAPAGMDAFSAGSPTVVGPRFVGAAGINAGAFGTAFLENANRTIYPTGSDLFIPGVNEVIGPRVVKQGGFTTDPARYGAPIIDFAERVARNVTLHDVSYGLGAPVVTNSTRGIFPASASQEEVFGDHVIGNVPFSLVTTEGADDGAVGGDAVVDYAGGTQRIRAGGYYAFGMGRPYIEPHMVTPHGIDSIKWGSTFISNYIRTVDLNARSNGIDAFRYGTGSWVSNYIRYLDAEGFDHSIVWNPYGPYVNGSAARVFNVMGGIVVDAAIGGGEAFGSPGVSINLC